MQEGTMLGGPQVPVRAALPAANPTARTRNDTH